VVTLGTSGAVRRVVSAPTAHPRRRTWCYVVEGGERRRYLAGGAINSGGLVLQQVAERWYGDEPAARVHERMEAEAAAVEAGAEGLTVLPFVAGERGLIWTSDASWALVGYDEARHGRAHVARAAMESVAYCLAGLWEAVEEAEPAGPSGTSGDGGAGAPAGGVPEDEAIRLTGGVVRSGLWRQIVADVLGRRLSPVEAADASVMGAAWYGFRGAGVEAAAPRPEAERVIEPDGERAASYGAARQRFMRQCAERGWLT
jgi:gluconokinase